MPFDAALKKLAACDWNLEPVLGQLRPGLSKAVQIQGAFPSCANVGARLGGLAQAGRGAAEIIADACGADPLLSLRLLSAAASEFSALAPMPWSVAGVLRELGIERAAGLAREIGRLEDYALMYQGRAVSAAALNHGVLAGALAPRALEMLADQPMPADAGLIVCKLLNLVEVLLGFYRPNIYAALRLKSIRDDLDFDEAFEACSGCESAAWGGDIARALALPQPMIDAVSLAHVPAWQRRRWTNEAEVSRLAAGSARISRYLADEILSFKGGRRLRRTCGRLSHQYKTSYVALLELAAESAERFRSGLADLGLAARLPGYVADLLPENRRDRRLREAQPAADPAPGLQSWITELRVCFKAAPETAEPGRLPQAVYCTLTGLVHGLKFDRAAFFIVDSGRGCLAPVFLYGAEVENFSECQRFPGASAEDMPDMQAIERQIPISSGRPIFQGGAAFTAFPVIWDGTAQGVFYAERAGGDRSRSQSLQAGESERGWILAMAESWCSVPIDFV